MRKQKSGSNVLLGNHKRLINSFISIQSFSIISAMFKRKEERNWAQVSFTQPHQQIYKKDIN